MYFSGIIIAVKNDKNRKRKDKIMTVKGKDIVLTTREAAKYLKISKPTFFKYIHSGKIKAVKVGNGFRVHQSELHRFLNLGEE